MEEHTRLARDLLFGPEVLNDTEQAPTHTSAAQVWATLAVADAIDRLAGAVEALAAGR
jgi:hypothetical protein